MPNACRDLRDTGLLTLLITGSMLLCACGKDETISVPDTPATPKESTVAAPTEPAEEVGSISEFFCAAEYSGYSGMNRFSYVDSADFGVRPAIYVDIE